MSYSQKQQGAGNAAGGGGPNQSNQQTAAKALAGMQQQMQNLVHGQNALPQAGQSASPALNPYANLYQQQQSQQQRFETLFKQQLLTSPQLQQHFQQQMQSKEPLALTRTPAAAELLNKSYQQHHQQANGSSSSSVTSASSLATNLVVNQQFQQLQATLSQNNLMQQLQAYQFQMQKQQQQSKPLQQQLSALQVQTAAQHLQQIQQLQQQQQQQQQQQHKYLATHSKASSISPSAVMSQIKPPNLPPSTQITPVPSPQQQSNNNAPSKGASAKMQISPSVSLIPAKSPSVSQPTPHTPQKQTPQPTPSGNKAVSLSPTSTPPHVSPQDKKSPNNQYPTSSNNIKSLPETSPFNKAESLPVTTTATTLPKASLSSPLAPHKIPSSNTPESDTILRPPLSIAQLPIHVSKTSPTTTTSVAPQSILPLEESTLDMPTVKANKDESPTMSSPQTPPEPLSEENQASKEEDQELDIQSDRTDVEVNNDDDVEMQTRADIVTESNLEKEAPLIKNDKNIENAEELKHEDDKDILQNKDEEITPIEQAVTTEHPQKLSPTNCPNKDEDLVEDDDDINEEEPVKKKEAKEKKPQKVKREEIPKPTPQKKTVKNATKPIVDNTPDSERKSNRHRLKTILYQSPLPELAYITKLSASEASNSPKPAPVDDKLIVFYKSEYMAVRNAEGGFFLCQTMQNVHKSSPKIRIRWLSEAKEGSNIYIPDFYDHTDIECVLTTVELCKAGKGQLQLPSSERTRIENILKKAIDVEKGILPRPNVTEENPDGLDISLYKDESQIEKKINRVQNIKSSKSSLLGKRKVTKSKAKSPKKKKKKTKPQKQKQNSSSDENSDMDGNESDSDDSENDSEYKPHKKNITAANTQQPKVRAQRSPLARARAASPITPTTSRSSNSVPANTPTPSTSYRNDRAHRRTADHHVPEENTEIVSSKKEPKNNTTKKNLKKTPASKKSTAGAVQSAVKMSGNKTKMDSSVDKAESSSPVITSPARRPMRNRK